MARGTQHVTRTKSAFKDAGYIIDQVERRIPAHKGSPFGKTHDFIGIIDLIAFDSLWTVGVQVCGQDFSSHHKKITGTDGDKFAEDNLNNALKWLECPHRRLELWGWRKVVVRNKDGSKAKQKRWKPRIRKYDFNDGALTWRDE
jgi:hypothetical protein